MGQLLNLVGVLAAGGATLLSATVTTVDGVVPMVVLAPLLAVGFGLRFGGILYARSQERELMPWGMRAGSWVAFGFAVLLLGLAGSAVAIGAFAAFVVLDAAAAFAKREKRDDAPPRKPFPLKRALWGALALAYAGGVVAFHILVAPYLSYGTLITWTLLALAFAFVLRLNVVGPKAGEAWLRAPLDHKKHERREAAVADPARAKAEEAVLSFRARGDAAPFLDLVREAARAADLKPEDVATLETRILSSMARAGTARDDDILAALDEVERFLSLKRPLEARP